jgi:N-acetylneuraminate synthase
MASLEWVESYFPNLPMLKVASSNARKFDFIREVNDALGERPVVLSVAGSTLQEIKQAVGIFGERSIYVLHCVAEYPCRSANLRLGNIPRLIHEFADRPNVKIGYSGHEIGILPSIWAVRSGAEMVERHFCLSRHSFVHHIECSLEPHQFAKLVEAGGVLPSPIIQEAFKCDFGMTKTEAEFLKKQTYGKSFLGRKSTWKK